MQSKGKKTFERILSSALRNCDLTYTGITFHTSGEPVNVSLTTAEHVREFHTSDDCANPKSLGDPSDRKLIIVLQRIRRIFGRIVNEYEISRFLTNRKAFFTYLIALTSP